MFADPTEVLDVVATGSIRMVDLKIDDLPGRWHHVPLPTSQLSAEKPEHGVGIDTSSTPGYKSVEAGDMRVVADLATGMLDPFCQARTLNFVCNIVEAMSGEPYPRDPRGVAARAEQYAPGSSALGRPRPLAPPLASAREAGDTAGGMALAATS